MNINNLQNIYSMHQKFNNKQRLTGTEETVTAQKPVAMDKAEFDFLENIASNSPSEVKNAFRKAAEDSGFNFNGKITAVMAPLIELHIQQEYKNSSNPYANLESCLGNDKSSAIKAVEKILNKIKNPATRNPNPEVAESQMQYYSDVLDYLNK